MSSVWEPPLFESDEAYERYIEGLKIEALQRSLDEQERCRNLRGMMEQAICRRFKGKGLKKIQPYKEAIFEYLKENLNYRMEYSSDILGWYIEIYYKHLTSKQLSIGEVSFLQSNSRTFDNDVTRSLRNRYFECDNVLNEISILTGTNKDEIIKLIEGSVSEQHALDEFVNKVATFFALKKNGTPSGISVSNFYEAIETIRELRNRPYLMGLTYDGMHLKMDKKLPPLKPKNRF